jgi:hypothetical protein
LSEIRTAGYAKFERPGVEQPPVAAPAAAAAAPADTALSRYSEALRLRAPEAAARPAEAAPVRPSLAEVIASASQSIRAEMAYDKIKAMKLMTTMGLTARDHLESYRASPGSPTSFGASAGPQDGST